MRRITVCLSAIACVALLAGCAGKPLPLTMKDTSGKDKQVVFPKGTIAGKSSTEQSQALAQMTAESHNTLASQMGDMTAANARNTSSVTDKVENATQRLESELKKLDNSGQKVEATTAKIETNTVKIESSVRKVEEATQKLDTTTQKIDGTTLKTLETAERTSGAAARILSQVEAQAKIQGTGELTLFFPVGSSVIARGSLEYGRLVSFMDFLSRESRGRKVLFVAVGSASAFGDSKYNEKLARERSEAPKAIIAQYLVNTTHEFFRVYGTGDAYSPKNVSMDEHQRYQAVRLIAVFENTQLPPTPEETAAK